MVYRFPYQRQVDNTVEYRRLGRSGLKVSALSFGSWITFVNQLDDAGAKALIAHAYEAGVNFFDCAEGYAHGDAERMLGRVLKSLGPGRDTYCLSSKVFWGGTRPTQVGLSRKHITDACHMALQRLGTNYIDIFYCHRPDPDTPILETVRAMHDLIVQGKVLYWGTSEWNPWQLESAYKLAHRYRLHSPSVEQPQYNLLSRFKVETALKPLVRRYGLGITSWSPLASGVLSGKYNQGIPTDSRMDLPGYEWLRKNLESPSGQQALLKVKALQIVADELDCTSAQLAIAWCLKNPSISSVILGASSTAQLRENLDALQTLPRLDAAALRQIDAITAEPGMARFEEWAKLKSHPMRSRLKRLLRRNH